MRFVLALPFVLLLAIETGSWFVVVRWGSTDRLKYAFVRNGSIGFLHIPKEDLGASLGHFPAPRGWSVVRFQGRWSLGGWLPSRRFKYLWLVPIWNILLLAALPAVCLVWRGRRTAKDHCQQCGYNLKGNISGRCPECGRAVLDRAP